MINNKKLLTIELTTSIVGMIILESAINSSKEVSVTKIQKLSSYLLVIFNILLIGVPLLIAFLWIFIETKTADMGPVINFFGLFEKEILTPEGYVNLSTVNWTPSLKFLGFIADIIGLLPFLLSLFILKSIFTNYKNCDIFNSINPISYRNLGFLFLADALIIRSLSDTLLILATTLTNPPGHHYLSASFGTPNLSSLFCGIIIIAVSWVMLEASKLYEEQKLTV